jgi:hypothetical protein
MHLLFQLHFSSLAHYQIGSRAGQSNGDGLGIAAARDGQIALFDFISL